MPTYNPVDDAQRTAFGRQPRGRQALDVARAFLQSPDLAGGTQGAQGTLPPQASPVAQQRGATQRRPAPQARPGGVGPGNATSPITTFLTEPAMPDRALLNHVMQRVFPRRRF